MWGANGGAGVLASIAAVIVSMSAGIEWNLLLAGVGYVTLPLLARELARGPVRDGGVPVERSREVAAAESAPPRVDPGAATGCRAVDLDGRTTHSRSP